MNAAMNRAHHDRLANAIRALAMDAVEQAKSGHPGLPMGAADIATVLFTQAMKFDPADPSWPDRDRFILSAGHGSMFLYAWLHLSGYDLSIEEVKRFRQLHSKTPGHPEYHETPGVECTTGPLGQGVGNAVGMAVAGQMAAARFNTPEHPIFDYHVVCLAGDGCMQEGVAMEAASFAGHQGLDNLILIYDANDVTLDAMADKTQSENAALRFKAMGWDVQTLADGHDFVAILKARFPTIVSPHKEDICYATTNRQAAVKSIAPRSDRVIVVGAPNSSNSLRLVEVAERAGCPKALLIQRAHEISWDDFEGIRTLGVTAGASAPQVLVDEIIDAFRARYDVTVESVVTAKESIAFNVPRELRDDAPPRTPRRAQG